MLTFYQHIQKRDLTTKLGELFFVHYPNFEKVKEELEKIAPDLPFNRFDVLKSLKVIYTTHYKKKNETAMTTAAPSFFETLATEVDKVLALELPPQGAILQNILKGCVLRIKELEQTDDLKKDTSIVKYVGEIRNLMQDINKEYKEQVLSRKEIKRIVDAEIKLLIDTVRDTIQEVVPDKKIIFEQVLQGKLLSFKKELNSNDTSIITQPQGDTDATTNT